MRYHQCLVQDIARWYTYYNSDSYFSKLDLNKKIIIHTLTGLWATFTLLNLLIPIISITRGKQIFQKLTKITATSNPRVYRATALVMVLFNFIWSLSALVLHISGYPSLLNCLLITAIHPCRIPPTVTSYFYVLGMLITKAVVLPLALLTELVVAVYI